MSSLKVGEFLRERKMPITKEELIPAKGFRNLFYTNELENHLLSNYPIGIENLFVHEKEDGTTKVAIVTDCVAYVLPDTSVDYLVTFEDSRRFAYLIDYCKLAIENKDYQSIFAYEGYSNNTILLYQLFKDKLSLEEQWDLLLNIYCNINYGFDEFFISEVKKLRSQLNLSFKAPQSLLDKADSDGFIKVYRGQENYSTPADRAISWTISYKTAIMFASQFSLDGDLVEGYVHIDDIWAFVEDHKEDEILSDKVQRIRSVDQYGVQDMTKILEQPVFGSNGVTGLDYLNYHLLTFEKSLFKNPTGIHGYLHMKRVLNLTLTLAQLKKLNQSETFLLCLIAKYHDVGRLNDYEDYEHGIRSWKKVKDILEVADLQSDYKHIVKFVIETHNIGDQRAAKKLKNSPIKDKDKELAWKLYSTFCDADNLDRVRINDLDPSYLRLEESKKLVLYAKACLQYINQ